MLSSNQSPRPEWHDLDLVFHALGDKTRRKLLRRLAKSPATVTELAAPFAMSLPAVSKHLRVLEKAGLLSRTINGRSHHCALNALPLREVNEWLGFYQAFWNDALDALADFVEDDTRHKAPGRDTGITRG